MFLFPSLSQAYLVPAAHFFTDPDFVDAADPSEFPLDLVLHAAKNLKIDLELKLGAERARVIVNDHVRKVDDGHGCRWPTLAFRTAREFLRYERVAERASILDCLCIPGDLVYIYYFIQYTMYIPVFEPRAMNTRTVNS